MRVLILHCYHQQPGGEESSVAADLSVLDALGAERDVFTDTNTRAAVMGRLRLSVDTVWSRQAAARLRAVLARRRYDVAHVHNTFPLLSPAVLHVLKEFRTPVVHTLHNYRLLCINGLLFRGREVCDACVGKRFPIASLYRSCYHRGPAAGAVAAAQLLVHRALRTYRNKVDTFLAFTQLARQLFIRGGLPGERILVRPNFLPDPGTGDGCGGAAVFAGRLSEEKGIPHLLAAWQRAPLAGQLRIIGDGPLRPAVERAAQMDPRIRYLGPQSRDEVMRNLRRALFLVFPSVCYEGMPMAILEAFAAGTPVLAYHWGAMSEMIAHGQTGWLVPERTPEGLAAAAGDVFAHPENALALRSSCRAEYVSRYSVSAAATSLRAAYEHAKALSASGAESAA